jgi:hypothetical protein
MDAGGSDPAGYEYREQFHLSNTWRPAIDSSQDPVSAEGLTIVHFRTRGQRRQRLDLGAAGGLPANTVMLDRTAPTPRKLAPAPPALSAHCTTAVKLRAVDALGNRRRG